MTTQSTTTEADQADTEALAAAELPPHVDHVALPRELSALQGPRTYEVDAQTFDDVTAELHDIAGCLEMLALISESTRGPLQCDGDHHAALFRVLHRDTHRCVQRLEAN